ncbi:hypothetical protein AAKU52_001497 [Pedobacter sp. CG_S7]|uniref:hypothetical protein n=1 Tax=Pedobacter sp. CG_S7 TaxID=3143930 RepID=UPI003397BFF5
MPEFEVHQPEFEIQVNLNGADETLTVKPEETSDGVSFYSCLLHSKPLTQIRWDENGSWEQLWGHLHQPEINIIGAAIKARQ